MFVELEFTILFILYIQDEEDDGTVQQAAPLRSRSNSVSRQGPAWSRDVQPAVSNSFHTDDTMLNTELDVSLNHYFVSSNPQSTDEQKEQQTGDER